MFLDHTDSLVAMNHKIQKASNQLCQGKEGKFKDDRVVCLKSSFQYVPLAITHSTYFDFFRLGMRPELKLYPCLVWHFPFLTWVAMQVESPYGKKSPPRNSIDARDEGRGKRRMMKP